MRDLLRSKPKFQGKRIVLVGSVIWDIDLHKMTYLEIANGMAERGHILSIIANRSRKKCRNQNPQVRVILFPLRYVPVFSTVIYTLALLAFVPFYIAFSKPDFIIVEPNTALSLVPMFFASKFSKAKIILDIRSTPVEMSGHRGFLKKMLFMASVSVAKKLFDGMTIITSLMKDEVCRTFGIDSGKLGVWSDGVSINLFNPKNYDSKAELRSQLRLTGKFVVFYHGAFTAKRALSETIDALKILRPAYHEIVLFLLGSGPIVTHLKNSVRELGLEDNVIIHEPVDHVQVPKYISMSDVCIVPLPDHPYWRYQRPLKLLEYLAMEKVVIVTDIPAHRSIIEGKNCGIYVSSIEPIEIAKSIEYAYRNKDKLKEWGKCGRTIIEEKYTWEIAARDLESYLLSIQ